MWRFSSVIIGLDEFKPSLFLTLQSVAFSLLLIHSLTLLPPSLHLSLTQTKNAQEVGAIIEPLKLNLWLQCLTSQLFEKRWWALQNITETIELLEQIEQPLKSATHVSVDEHHKTTPSGIRDEFSTANDNTLLSLPPALSLSHHSLSSSLINSFIIAISGVCFETFPTR
jgi:hypothetical protein